MNLVKLLATRLRGKAPISANSEALPSVKATLSCEPRVEAPSGAISEVISLQNRALLNNAKAPGARIASPRSKVITLAKSKLTKAYKAKSRVSLRLFSSSELFSSLPGSLCWID